MHATDHPPIRSYSGRRGHFTRAQKSAYERLLTVHGLPFSDHCLDFNAVFGRTAPRVVEIGFGMGETTETIARAHPQVDFIGIEVYPAGVGSLLRRIEESQLRNIRLIQHDAIAVLEQMIEPASLSAVHVFFPDPWPKARHHKRRLIRPEVVRLIASRLKPGGVLHCATDWGPYARWMLEVLAGEPTLENTAEAVVLEDSVEGCRGFAPRPGWRPLTRFEARGLRLGHPVWDLLFRRQGSLETALVGVTPAGEPIE
ncbi:MAG: tRNA (guanosine(46)-N7)-methyltransferase TrmB [Betaproteobacteria bacterium]|nr:tRNA (guanosine(46)-N7)-methyltransferase TrmB [Betaproteobacteria bacterium]